MPTRVLCLGNDLIADDAVGPAVARHLRSLRLPDVEVVETAESGLRLLDYLETPRLIIVDSICGGGSPPGTVYVFDSKQLPGAQGPSPHYVSLQESLLLAEALGLAVPEKITILAVEAADLQSLGGDMHQDVERAVTQVARLILEHLTPQPIQQPLLPEAAS